MRSRSLALLVAFACASGWARAEESDPRRAELEDLRAGVERLEARIAELESAEVERGGGAASDWPRRVRLGGSANLSHLEGHRDGLYSDDATQVFDARLFIDADLASDAQLGDVLLFRDAGLSFELSLARLGEVEPEIGELYADVRGIFGHDWLNVSVGRFQIPFGEGYQRYSRGYSSDPFIALTAPPPWYWDEGLKLWGSLADGRFFWVASVTDGENADSGDVNDEKQMTLKLALTPFERLTLSVSALRSGELGSSDENAVGALWLGEALPVSFGAWTSVPQFHDGVEVPDGPPRLHDVWVLGADAVYRGDAARIWLSAGRADFDSDGPSLYDRQLLYWLAEVVVQGRSLSPALGSLYFAARGAGLGTYDGGEGYVLDLRYGDSLGYNMRSLDSLAFAIGLPIGDHLTLKAQYALQWIELVRGAREVAALRAAARRADFLGMEIGVRF